MKISRYKTYEETKQISLPPPLTTLKNNKKDKREMIHKLEDLFYKRKSIRSYKNEAINLIELSFLLWASNGLKKNQGNFEFRTVPSAGALYPIETYISVRKLKDRKGNLLDKGIYHYNVKDHKLEYIIKKEQTNSIYQAAIQQEMCMEAAVILINTAIFARSEWKYGKRAMRYILIDLGHIGQNLSLAITALRLGGCHIGAFQDPQLNKILDIDGNKESTLYLTTIGRKKD